jgi:NAD(P)-dependent dehydrogenase (short-subunit alcohol dehydrogenase family)/acyl carrier protein
MLQPNGPTSSGSLADRSLSSAALAETVLSIIAEVTRYPRDILQPAANLEEDLGIDSLKRAEIFAVLRARLQLPEPPKDESTLPPPPRTIGDVLVAVETVLRKGPEAAAPVTPPPAPGSVQNGQRAGPISGVAIADALAPRGIVEIIAEVTRYPIDLLKADADLEEDLGFDLKQRRAIFAALRSKLRLTLPETAPVPEVRTVGDIVATVSRFLPPSASEAPLAPPLASIIPENRRPQRQPSLVSAGAFHGKVALVTGSGHGIGKAIATRLADLGATVVVNSFHSRQMGEDTAAEIVGRGSQAVHLWGSVTNPAHLKQIFQEIDSRFGGLDFLVSNASNGILAPVKDIQPEHWERAFRTNVVGLHQTALLAAEQMRRRGGGKIVALSSVGAQRCLDYLACIGTVKAAVESLVRYLAVELGADNIQVNAVSAGPVYGDLMEKYPDLETLRPRCEAQTPRHRLNDALEVAEAVMFLLCSSGMSGSVLLVDAGGSQRIRPATT